jgi:hypothetical protein
VKLGRQVSVTGVNSHLNGYWPVSLAAKAGDQDLPGRYLALDLSKLSAACSNRVDGLIGADFLRDRVVQIDYAAQKLRLLARSNAGNDADVIPLEIRPCGLRVRVSVNEATSGWVRLDTGCATALQWVTSEVPSENCSRKPAVGLVELSIPQTETSIRIGTARADHVPTGLHREAIFPGESGLIGNELLARFEIITIDARNQRLILGRTAVK